MITQKQMSGRAWVEMLILAILWGGVFFTVAIALQEIEMFGLVAIRVTIAAVLLWVYVLFLGRPIPNTAKVWFALLIMGILNTALPFTLLTYGQTQIESGLTAIFNAGTAVMGTLVAAIFLSDEKLTRRKTVGVGFGIAGAITAIGIESLQTFDLRSLGQLSCIGATISYAFAGVWARKNLVGVRPDVATAGMLTGATLVMIPAALFIEGVPNFNWSLGTWLALLYYIPLATCFAYLMYFRILEMAGSANTLLVTLLVAPIAITLGAIFLDENLPLNSFVGFALIAIGLAIIDGRAAKLVRQAFSS